MTSAYFSFNNNNRTTKVSLQNSRDDGFEFEREEEEVEEGRRGRSTPITITEDDDDEHAQNFPRMSNILWDCSANTTNNNEIIVWSSECCPSVFDFRDESEIAKYILSKYFNKATLYEEDEREEEENRCLYAEYAIDDDGNSTNSAVVRISAPTLTTTSRAGGPKHTRHLRRRRKIPLEISFLDHRKKDRNCKKEDDEYERMSKKNAWGKSLTSVRESFHALCDTLPLTNRAREEENEKEDETATPLDMWPMRAGAVIEQLKNKNNNNNNNNNKQKKWKVHITIALEMPSCAFRFAPIRPLRYSKEFSTSSQVVSALENRTTRNSISIGSSNRSNNYNSSKKKKREEEKKETKTGFLTLDRARRMCFLRTKSKRVQNLETSLVGVWVQRKNTSKYERNNFLRSSEVWAACLRYASNSVLRKVSQNGSFLLCLVNNAKDNNHDNNDDDNGRDNDDDDEIAVSSSDIIECYDCVATQGKEPFVAHQIDVTLELTNNKDIYSNEKSSRFVLGAGKEIERASIDFLNDEDDEEEDEELFGSDNFYRAGDTFEEEEDRRRRTTTNKNNNNNDNNNNNSFPNASVEAQREVEALKKALRSNIDDYEDYDSNNNSSNSPRSLATALVKQAERSFLANRFISKERKKNIINNFSTAARTVRFFEVQEEEEEKEKVKNKLNNNGLGSNNTDDKIKDDDLDLDDDDDDDAHILRKYTS